MSFEKTRFLLDVREQRVEEVRGETIRSNRNYSAMHFARQLLLSYASVRGGDNPTLHPKFHDKSFITRARARGTRRYF